MTVFQTLRDRNGVTPALLSSPRKFWRVHYSGSTTTYEPHRGFMAPSQEILPRDDMEVLTRIILRHDDEVDSSDSPLISVFSNKKCAEEWAKSEGDHANCRLAALDATHMNEVLLVERDDARRKLRLNIPPEPNEWYCLYRIPAPAVIGWETLDQALVARRFTDMEDEDRRVTAIEEERERQRKAKMTKEWEAKKRSIAEGVEPETESRPEPEGGIMPLPYWLKGREDDPVAVRDAAWTPIPVHISDGAFLTIGGEDRTMYGQNLWYLRQNKIVHDRPPMKGIPFGLARLPGETREPIPAWNFLRDAINSYDGPPLEPVYPWMRALNKNRGKY